MKEGIILNGSMQPILHVSLSQLSWKRKSLPLTPRSCLRGRNYATRWKIEVAFWMECLAWCSFHMLNPSCPREKQSPEYVMWRQQWKFHRISFWHGEQIVKKELHSVLLDSDNDTRQKASMSQALCSIIYAQTWWGRQIEWHEGSVLSISHRKNAICILRSHKKHHTGRSAGGNKKKYTRILWWENNHFKHSPRLCLPENETHTTDEPLFHPGDNFSPWVILLFSLKLEGIQKKTSMGISVEIFRLCLTQKGLFSLVWRPHMQIVSR